MAHLSFSIDGTNYTQVCGPGSKNQGCQKLRDTVQCYCYGDDCNTEDLIENWIQQYSLGKQ